MVPMNFKQCWMAKLERPHFFKVQSDKITVWYVLPKFNFALSKKHKNKMMYCCTLFQICMQEHYTSRLHGFTLSGFLQ